MRQLIASYAFPGKPTTAGANVAVSGLVSKSQPQFVHSTTASGEELSDAIGLAMVSLPLPAAYTGFTVVGSRLAPEAAYSTPDLSDQPHNMLIHSHTQTQHQHGRCQPSLASTTVKRSGVFAAALRDAAQKVELHATTQHACTMHKCSKNFYLTKRMLHRIEVAMPQSLNFTLKVEHAA